MENKQATPFVSLLLEDNYSDFADFYGCNKIKIYYEVASEILRLTLALNKKNNKRSK